VTGSCEHGYVYIQTSYTLVHDLFNFQRHSQLLAWNRVLDENL